MAHCAFLAVITICLLKKIHRMFPEGQIIHTLKDCSIQHILLSPQFEMFNLPIDMLNIIK